MKQTSEIIVVNARAIPPCTACLYIGRPVPGYSGSPLANPFRIKNETERPEALQKYREWLEEQMKTDTPARREIELIARFITDQAITTGKFALICWCAPKACHGDVVKEVVERVIRER